MTKTKFANGVGILSVRPEIQAEKLTDLEENRCINDLQFKKKNYCKTLVQVNELFTSVRSAFLN